MQNEVLKGVNEIDKIFPYTTIKDFEFGNLVDKVELRWSLFRTN